MALPVSDEGILAVGVPFLARPFMSARRVEPIHCYSSGLVPNRGRHMSKVIELPCMSSDYRSAFDEILERLDAIANELQESTESLAMLGPWRKWGDDQRVGTVVKITGRALLESGDPRVVALVHLVCSIRQSTDELRKLAHSRTVTAPSAP